MYFLLERTQHATSEVYRIGSRLQFKIRVQERKRLRAKTTPPPKRPLYLSHSQAYDVNVLRSLLHITLFSASPLRYARSYSIQITDGPLDNKLLQEQIQVRIRLTIDSADQRIIDRMDVEYLLSNIFRYVSSNASVVG